MKKQTKIRLTLIDKKGKYNCHHGHKIGDSFDFETDRGKLCPMAVHVAFPYIEIIKYGGTPPERADSDAVTFCCPDADVINIFRIDKIDTL